MRVRTGLHLTNFSFPGIAEPESFKHAVAVAVAAEAAGFRACLRCKPDEDA